MKTKLLFLLFLTICFCTNLSSQCNDDWSIQEANGNLVENPIHKIGWHIIIHDEFEGTSLSNLWGKQDGTHSSTTPPPSYVRSQNVIVEDNVLKLFSVKETPPYEKDGNIYYYTGAWVKSNAIGDLYGPGFFYEIRAKRSTVGTKSSFWTYHRLKDEIDFIDNAFEEESDTHEIRINVYNSTIDPPDTLMNKECEVTIPIDNSIAGQDEGWHTFAGDVRDDFVGVYLNNQLVLTKYTEIPTDIGSMNIWSIPIDYITYDLSGVPFPLATEVDYFRTYRMNSSIETPVADFGYAQGWTDQNQRPRLIGDINGDGKDDILGFKSTYAKAAISDCNTTTSFVTTNINNFYSANSGWSNQNERPRFLEDINGDNKADVIAFGYNTLYVSLSTSSENSTIASFASPYPVMSEFTYAQQYTNQEERPRMMADVNGDGKADIVGFGVSKVYVSLSTTSENATTPSFSAPVEVATGFTKEQGFSNQEERPRMMADINGDGKADIVGFGDSKVYVSLSTSSLTEASFDTTPDEFTIGFTEAQGWYNQETRPRMMADVNGDGMDDIVGFGSSSVYVSLSTSSLITASFRSAQGVASEFTANQGYTSLTDYPRMVVDLDNDGMADIIGFKDNVVRVAKSKSLTTSADFHDYNNLFEYFTPCHGFIDKNTSPRIFGDIYGDGSLSLIGFGYNKTYTYVNLGGVYTVPFEILNSTTDKSDNWNLNYTDGSDVAYKFYLHDRTTVSLSTCHSETEFASKIQVFDLSRNSQNTWYKYFGSNCTSGTALTLTLDPGYYYVVVDGYTTGKFKLTATGTVLKSASIDDVILEEMDEEEFEEIVIYPNPAKDLLNLELPIDVYSVEIIDISGKVMIKTNQVSRELSIDVRGLQKGIYIVKVNREQKTETKRVVIQ